MPIPRTRTIAADTAAWEAYRIYQRDLLLECFEDVEHILRRMRVPPNDEDRRALVALLWEKRCQPWKYYRDEQRALVAR
ncbi:MAG TPA: hypothetical protein VHH36_03180 [Candidatus Thermoplasmatota archaeon]|nr:hypothetical protein [Candidatus Thermoplasmatota archaeon]